jgi:DNA processing protein
MESRRARHYDCIDEFPAVTPAEIAGVLNDVEAKYAPARLYYAGDRSLLERGPRIAIVGSRTATPSGLARARVVVVSGLAKGIDTTAHNAAMDRGGRTIAVLGTPLNRHYPAENAALQDRIAREHLIVSQFPVGYPVTPKNFPIRNRTMAFVTDATVIVEAGEESGALYQGWEVLRLGRPLFLLENVAMNPELTWPADMIKHGAKLLTRNSLDMELADVPVVTARAYIQLDDVL